MYKRGSSAEGPAASLAVEVLVMFNRKQPGVDKCNHTAATSHYILGCRGRLRTAAMWKLSRSGLKKKMTMKI